MHERKETQMQVAFTAVVVFDPVLHEADAHRGTQQEEEEEEDEDSRLGRTADAWNPVPRDPTSLKDDGQVLPNQACAWLDPFWTGLVCTLDSGAAPQKPFFVQKRSVAAVFRFAGEVRSTTPSLVQRLASEDEPQQVRSLCNSVKLHFFHTTAGAGGARETVRDFVYSSAFPLSRLTQPQADEDIYGLFNYNYKDSAATPLPGFRLAIFPVRATQLPPATSLFALRGPTEKHHERVMTLCAWLKETVHRVCTDVDSEFANMRTYCRDQGSTGLFQDLHRLMDTPGTCLPPTVALYALHAALMLSDLEAQPRALLALLSRSVPLFMRTVRNVIACPTLCCVEGVYWMDLSLRHPVEDQPHPLTFMPSDRVFTKDDCEGRALQVQQMVLLLRWMYLSEQRVGLDALVAAIRASRSYAALMGRLPDAYVRDLISTCCALGELFERGVLEAQTTVGDVRFGSVHEAVRDNTVGHSFVVLFLYKDGDKKARKLRHVTMVEATGWEQARIEGVDPPITEAESRLMFTTLPALIGADERHYDNDDPRKGGGGAGGAVCGMLPPEVENRVYERLVLGKGCIYFTRAAGDKLLFGARLADVRRATQLDYAEGQHPQGAFRMETREFIAAQPDSAKMLAIYDAIERDLPATRRCLRPPQKSEAEVEDTMIASWAPITPESISAWQQRRRPGGGVLFVMPQRRLTGDMRKKLNALRTCGFELRSFPYMGSCIFHAYAH